MPKQAVPLRQWLSERLEQFNVSEAKQKRYRSLRATLEILEAHCTPCDSFTRETCVRFRGCGKEGKFRHALISVTGSCPLGRWNKTYGKVT
jgi:hypothetical protein